MKKRFVISVLVVSLLSALCSGCNTPTTAGESSASGEETEVSLLSDQSESESSADTQSIDGEGYTVRFMYMVASESSGQDAVAEAVDTLSMEELSMHTELIPITIGAYNSTISMTLASNEPLDLLPVVSTMYSSHISSGYVRNWADYIDYIPDVLEVVGEDVSCCYVGDFLIGLPLMKERAYQAGVICRADIMDELGYSVDDFSVTVEDYDTFGQITELFEAVKQAYPDMTVLNGTSIMGKQVYSYFDGMGDSFGVLADYGQTTTVTNWYESDQFYQFCSIAHDWFEAGYESADIATNQDSGETLMKAGNTFCYINNVKPNTAVEKLAQTGYEVYIIPISDRMTYSGIVNATSYGLANASEDPVKAAQFMNWVYTSESFMDLINWGIEGVDWVEDENGQAAYPDGIDATNVSYHQDYGWIYPNQFAGHAWAGNPTDIWDQYREYNASLLKSLAYGFTFDSTVVTNEVSQCTSVLSQYQNDLAFGVLDLESGISEFNEKLYGAGLQNIIDAKQEQLNQWLEEQ